MTALCSRNPKAASSSLAGDNILPAQSSHPNLYPAYKEYGLLFLMHFLFGFCLVDDSVEMTEAVLPFIYYMISTLASISSTICTLILPLLKSEHVCSASIAFSSGYVWLTRGFKSRIPPLKHCRPAGQVSLYRLMNLRSI
jgi:hypothetical protein